MSVRDERRASAIDRMAVHLLGEGLSGASLRSLASAAGTSDRMLLYYFKDKTELLSATLQKIAVELGGILDEALPQTARYSFPALLHEVWSVMISPSLKPYMNLWLELAAAAAHGDEPYCTVGGLMADGFLAWTASRLDKEEPDCSRLASLLLTIFEGLLMLQAVGRGALAERAIAALAVEYSGV